MEKTELHPASPSPSRSTAWRQVLRSHAIVWLCLMLLLAATAGSAFIHLGIWNGIINMAIAAIKVMLVALFFMKLAGARGVIRVVAAAGLLGLSLLFMLSSTDYATRALHTAPWQFPGPTGS